MIVYPITCEAGHEFEGWYANPEAFDKLHDAGQVECPVCGSSHVEKLPSAPHVHTRGSSARASEPTPEQIAAVRAAAVGELRAFILANTEDVGRKFAEIARRMHYGEEDHRGIRGRVTPEEAAELQEEGVDAYAVSGELELDEVKH